MAFGAGERKAGSRQSLAWNSFFILLEHWTCLNCSPASYKQTSPVKKGPISVGRPFHVNDMIQSMYWPDPGHFVLSKTAIYGRAKAVAYYYAVGMLVLHCWPACVPVRIPKLWFWKICWPNQAKSGFWLTFVLKIFQFLDKFDPSSLQR